MVIKIVVLQRGWVVVGNVKQHEGDPQVVIEQASVIRRWGSNRGLGLLASSGPQPNTVLDPTGTVRVHELAVVMMIDCDAEKWEGHVASN